MKHLHLGGAALLGGACGVALVGIQRVLAEEKVFLPPVAELGGLMGAVIGGALCFVVVAIIWNAAEAG